MSKQDPPKLIVVLGPTASGKSALAVRAARRTKGEVVSADSRQVYRGMDIGTGKITKKEMQGVRHHLLDVVSPRSAFSMARYQKLALRAVEDIRRRKKIPILCGGTGFYIDAVVNDFSLPQAKPDPLLRKELEAKSNEELLAELAKRDPERAKAVDPRNKRRLVRALEIVFQTGAPVPVLVKRPRFETLKLGILLPPDRLRKRIRERLRARMKAGLVAEVEKLHRSGISWKRLDDFGLEYRYASRFLKGELAEHDMLRILEKEIWQYAKRQMTWFRRDKEIVWIDDPKRALPLIRSFLKS